MIKKIIFIIFIVVLLVVIISIEPNKPYVATINGQKIYLSEYKVYLSEQVKMFEQIGGEDIWEVDFNGELSENVAKKNALNTIVKVKITNKNASSLKVSLTEEEKEECLKWAEQMYEDIKNENLSDPEITLEELTKILIEIEVYDKSYSKVTENFEISEKDFLTYYATIEDRMDIENARQVYSDLKKSEIFNAQYKIWEKNFKIKRNNEVFEEIKIK